MTQTAARAPRQLLRPGWRGTAQVALGLAVVVGATAAAVAERTTVHAGFAALHHIRSGWLAAAVAAEIISMVGIAQLQRGLLRSVGARHTLRAVLATAYSSNVISVAVPVIGSGIATAWMYRDFRRSGTAPELVSTALTVAGVFSSVAFAAVAAAGALVMGNPAAAVAGLAGSAALAGAVAAVIAALHSPRARGWLIRRVTGALLASRRLIRRPKGEPGPLVTTALERVAALRLGYLAAARALVWALVNWLADVACLACAIRATGQPVPWAALIIVWSAGAGAASFSPVPAGIGVVDVVPIAALARAGLHDGAAVAAVLLYRLISLKPLNSAGWLAYHALARPGRARRASRTAT